jgi:hypothetical protein
MTITHNTMPSIHLSIMKLNSPTVLLKCNPSRKTQSKHHRASNSLPIDMCSRASCSSTSTGARARGRIGSLRGISRSSCRCRLARACCGAGSSGNLRELCQLDFRVLVVFYIVRTFVAEALELRTVPSGRQIPP